MSPPFSQNETREVVEVERVLRTEVATDVALADEPARVAVYAVQILVVLDSLAGNRRPARIGERDREVRQLPRNAQALTDLAHRLGLRCRRVWLVLERVALRSDHLLDGVVMGIELLARHRPIDAVVMYEPVGVLPQQDVGVDDRAAAETARDERLDSAKVLQMSKNPNRPLLGSQKLREISRG